jgi:hypothetical protein
MMPVDPVSLAQRQGNILYSGGARGAPNNTARSGIMNSGFTIYNRPENVNMTIPSHSRAAVQRLFALPFSWYGIL